MYSTTIYLTTEQKTFFKDRHKQSGIPIAVQMREAFDLYIEKNNKEVIKR